MIEEKENKTKADLLVEINNLKKQISDNEDFLTDIGIIQKETFMSRIEAIEENTAKKIEAIINDCVAETGREFPWVLFKKMDNVKYDIFLPKQAEKLLNINSNQD